jgi:hypothetical protein
MQIGEKFLDFNKSGSTYERAELKNGIYFDAMPSPNRNPEGSFK